MRYTILINCQKLSVKKKRKKSQVFIKLTRTKHNFSSFLKLILFHGIRIFFDFSTFFHGYFNKINEE